MADHLGYSRSQLSRWLNDKGEAPRRSVLRMWALRCGVPFDWLVNGVGETGPNTPGGVEVSPRGCNGAQVIDFRARQMEPAAQAA
jgi:transcriptional regulator with XRE-family HTH domain